MTSPQPTTFSSDHRNRRIDALRGASALAVLIYHFNVGSYYPELRYWHHLTTYGYLGVAVFFVLSGYCIGQSWLKSPGPGSFFKRRFWRIYPAYFACVVFIVLCALLRKWLGGINDVARLPIHPKELLAVLTICTEPASAVLTMNWVFWSLTYEIFFYLLMGIVLLHPSAVPRRRTLLGLHLVFCVLALTGFSFSGTPLFFVDNWNLFALGIGACFLSAGAREAFGFLAVSAATLLAKAALGRFGPYDLAALVTISVLLAPQARFLPRSDQPLVFLGRISYSLYLFHVPVGLFLFMRLVRPWINSPYQFILMQVTGAIVVIAAAILAFQLFEKPFLRPRARPVAMPV